MPRLTPRSPAHPIGAHPMRSLRARLFVTAAVVLAAATVVAGLLSRQATLVEERQIVGPRRPPPLEGLAGGVAGAYGAGGWPRVRTELVREGAARGIRLLAIDTANRPVAASSPELEGVHVRAAGPDGLLSLESGGRESRASIEFRGVPMFAIPDVRGDTAGRVYVLPPDSGGPPPLSSPLVAPWIRTTAGTALVALVLAFLLGGRILRPITELTRAARRMREGDLDVRVDVRGDDEIGRLARAFNDMADRLARTERLKRQMVSDVAHELRSPVTNLRCALEAIQDGLAVADRDRIDALHSETLLLQRLIGDLQDLALADAGGLALQRERVDVAAVARRALGTDPEAPPVAFAIDPRASCVWADSGRLEQMLRNLVTNARRHTPAGGRVVVETAREGEHVLIRVADNGCGIPPEHLPHVFDRFYRVDPSRDRTTGGAGLGLAIVRRLAEAQGGSVAAASGGEGQGAAFTIRLSAAEHAVSHAREA